MVSIRMNERPNVPEWLYRRPFRKICRDEIIRTKWTRPINWKGCPFLNKSLVLVKILSSTKIGRSLDCDTLFRRFRTFWTENVVEYLCRNVLPDRRKVFNNRRNVFWVKLGVACSFWWHCGDWCLGIIKLPPVGGTFRILKVPIIVNTKQARLLCYLIATLRTSRLHLSSLQSKLCGENSAFSSCKTR